MNQFMNNVLQTNSEINLDTSASSAAATSAPPAPSGNNAGAALGATSTAEEERPPLRTVEAAASGKGSAVQGFPDSTPACGSLVELAGRIRDGLADEVIPQHRGCPNDDDCFPFARILLELKACRVTFPTSESRGHSSPACSTDAHPVTAASDRGSFSPVRPVAPSLSLAMDSAAPGRTQDAPGAVGMQMIPPHKMPFAIERMRAAAREIVEAGFDPTAAVRKTVDFFVIREINDTCLVVGGFGIDRLWKVDYVRLWAAFVGALAEAVSA